MNAQKLIVMSNSIGKFFENEPDPKEAISEIANHIKRTWTPAMIAKLKSHLAQQGDETNESSSTNSEELDPLVAQAVLSL